MKHLLFVLLSVLSLAADAQWAASYKQAFTQAKEQEKSVLVMLSQDNCKACWYMENIVFEDEVLIEKIEKEYVMLYLDVNDDDIHGLDYSGTPTLYFLTSDDKVLKRLNGVYNIKELTAAMLKIEKPKKEE